MLTTFLTPGEWLRGKMMGRLAPMLSVLIAGIPILSLMQLFGGVDITAVVMHTFLAAILMVATGMYSVYSSVHEKSAGSAVFTSYMLLLGGTFLGYLAAWPVSAILVLFSLASQLWLIAIVTLTVILLHLWLGVRSFRTAVRLLEKRTGDYDVTRSPAEQLDLDTRLKSLETELVKTIRKPSITSALEAKELEARAEIIQHVTNEKRKSRVYSNWPLVWKGAAYPPTIALIIISFMVILINLSITLAFIFATTTRSLGYDAIQFDGFMKFTLVPLMILVTLRASSLIVMERKAQTWLSLLTLPWSRTRLVAELAAGALWRYRWLLFTCILMLLSLAFYLRIEITLALLVAYFSQLIFFCLLGLLISAISRTVLISRIFVFAFCFAVFLCLPGLMQDTRWDGLSVLLPAQTWLSSADSMNRIDFISDVLAAVGIQTILSAACFGAICLLVKLQVER